MRHLYSLFFVSLLVLLSACSIGSTTSTATTAPTSAQTLPVTSATVPASAASSAAPTALSAAASASAAATQATAAAPTTPSSTIPTTASTAGPTAALTSVASPTAAGTGARLPVVAAENFWGSIASQVGGERVRVTSILTNPNADPHNYEPKPTDARLIATARYVIINGAGYDPWAPKLLAANPISGRKVLTIGDLVGMKDGDNPHIWYNPAYVAQAIDQITADLQALDPADAAYFDQQHAQFATVTLQPYHDLVSTIRQRYQGTPISSTESIIVYMSDALGLQLLTPPGFMQAISDGNEPTAAEKATFQQQVTQHQVKVFVNNKQNSTPDTDTLKQRAQTAGIPIVDITETLDPETATFQDWQTGQLQVLQQALAKATGK